MAEIRFPLESFVFYRSFRDAIEDMNDADKLETLLAICDYALYGTEPKLKSPMPRAIFTVARPSIDANNTRRANGGKGGRPPKEKPMVSETENQRFSKTESTETGAGAETGAGTESESMDRPPSRSHKFVSPTLEEVRDYCNERKNNVDPEKFIDYYDSIGWTRGKSKIRDWRACVRTWERRDNAESPTLSKGNYIAPSDNPGDWMEG